MTLAPKLATSSQERDVGSDATVGGLTISPTNLVTPSKVAHARRDCLGTTRSFNCVELEVAQSSFKVEI